MSALSLYRLLTPYFVAVFSFPEEVDAYLSKLGVEDLTAAYDNSATFLTGALTLGDAPGPGKVVTVSDLGVLE